MNFRRPQGRLLQGDEDHVTSQRPEHRLPAGCVHARRASMRRRRVHEVRRPQPVSTDARRIREQPRQKPRCQNAQVSNGFQISS